MNNIPENNNEAAFEAELFNSLMFYGYLFPEDVPQVEIFEQLFGTHAIDTPPIQDILATNTNASGIFDIEDMGLAAYSNEDGHLPELPDEDSTKPKGKDQF